MDNSFITAVNELAILAGKEIARLYQSPIEVTKKGDGSPVTEADHRANKIIVDGLKELLPEVPIVSEESPIPPFRERKHWKKFWLVDPLDGTKEFLKKTGEFTVNIALIENGEPILGVIYEPISPVLYFGAKGLGSFRKHGKEAKPQQIFSNPLGSGKTDCTVVESRSHRSDAHEKYVQSLQPKLRMHVGSSLKFAYLAEGKANIYPRLFPAKEWDVAAGDAIFRYSARHGINKTPFIYNTETLIIERFIIEV